MNTKNSVINKIRIGLNVRNIMKGYILIFGIFLITCSLLRAPATWERDSLNLPIISLQYRGSIITNESDLVHAKEDLPELYGHIDPSTYTPNTPPVKNRQREWLPYYFPIYPLVCLPAKILLQVLKMPQYRAFTLTNSVLVYFALIFVYKFLKVSDREKLITILLMSFSPIILYVSATTAAECMIFSFVTIALVLWHEKHYKSAAVFVVLAGWENPTVMMLGAVMIANFLIDLFRQDMNIKKFVFNNWKKIMQLAFCYIWCFVPFIVNYIFIGKANGTFVAASSNGYFGRLVSYFFDLNLGFASFALFLVIFIIMTLPVIVYKKHYPSIYLYAALFLTVAAFSVMRHINCGMIFCARYVMWTYPILVFLCVTNGEFLLRNKNVLYAVTNSVFCFSCLFFVIWETLCGINHSYFHNVFATAVLDNFPSLYNPISSTFYCRTRHIDGAYNETGACLYVDSSDHTSIRKILLPGNESDKLTLLADVKIEGNAEKFINKVNAVPNDGKPHYININKFDDFSVTAKNDEEKGIIEEKETLIDSGSIAVALSGNNEVGSYAQKIKIKPDTLYKIKISFDETSKNSNITRFYADIYNSEGYDRDAQQVEIYSATDDTLYIKTDDIPNGIEDAYVRLIAVTDKQIVLTGFSVTEMSYTDNPITYLSGNMITQNISKDIALKPYTDYIVTVNVDDYSMNDNEKLYVDFFGGSEYDNNDQQRDLTPGTINSFVINSGDTSAATVIRLRVVAVTEEPVHISVPRVQEVN